jgi:hypothetical protein
VHSRIALVGVREAGPPTVVEVRVTGDGYNGGGTFAVSVRDGRISRLTIRG